MVQAVLIPVLTQNDVRCLLVSWICNSGAAVQRGTALAVLETSKASAELLAEAAGIFEPTGHATQEYEYGSIVGYIFKDDVERQNFLSRQSQTKVESRLDSSSFVVSRAARELMREHDLNEADLNRFGKKMIKRADVQILVHANRTDHSPRLLELSSLQQTVSRTVLKAHQIPTGAAILRVDCGEALLRLREYTATEKQLIGLPELLVKTAAGLADRFPFFFGRVLRGDRFLHSPEPNIGVTLDLGKGLFVPVIRRPHAKSLREIAAELIRFRIKAMQNSFNAQDLSEGDISISLHTDRDVLVAFPLVVPGQACILSLNSPHAVLQFDSDRDLVERTYVNIGVTYDHRVINGSDAIQFLQAIKTSLEEPRLE